MSGQPSVRIRPFFCRRVVAACAMAVASGGCHDWVAVRPAEVTKMQNTEGGRPPRLERSNGALVEIDDDSEVRVVLSDGKQLEFTHPVSAKMDLSTLVIRGGNRGDRRIPLESVEKVQVSKFDGGTTALAIVAGVVGGLVATGLVAYEATRSASHP